MSQICVQSSKKDWQIRIGNRRYVSAIVYCVTSAVNQISESIPISTTSYMQLLKLLPSAA